MSQNTLHIHSLMKVLTLSMQGKIAAGDILKYFSYFSMKKGFDISCKLSPLETICLKCRILFSGKNEKNVINLSSSESAHSMVSVNFPLIETLGTVEFALMNRESPIQVLWNDRRI